MRKTGAVAHFILFSRPHQSYRGCQPAGFSSFTAFCFFPSILGSSGSVSPTFRDLCKKMKYLDNDRDIFTPYMKYFYIITFLRQQIYLFCFSPCVQCLTRSFHQLRDTLAAHHATSSEHLVFIFFFFFFLFCNFTFLYFCIFVFCWRMHLEITKVCVVSVCQEEHLLSMLALLLLNWNI